MIDINPGHPAVFNPSTLTVHVNDSVAWRNNDPNLQHHPAPSANDPTAWLDFPIAPNSTSSQISFDPAPASYTLNYVCAIHPDEKGQIKVIVGNKKKGSFGPKTKKGAFGGKSKKGAFAYKTK
jgi:plastocyanin